MSSSRYIPKREGKSCGSKNVFCSSAYSSFLTLYAGGMEDNYSKIFALMCAQSKWGTTLLFLALFGHFNLEINCSTNQWSVSVLVLFDTFQRSKFTSCLDFLNPYCLLF